MKSSITIVKQLIKALSMPSYDGRILLSLDATRSTLKFILLNPNVIFSEILNSARSVILAGGTMKPVNIYL
jgi:chromosome transmission fidelity protein 1